MLVSTTTIIVHPQIEESSSKTSDISRSFEELKALKERNHVEALRKFMSI